MVNIIIKEIDLKKYNKDDELIRTCKDGQLAIWLRARKARLLA